MDHGLTERRHVYARVDAIENIGKEANRWEEQFYVGVDEENFVAYARPGIAQSLRAELQQLARLLGERQLAARLGISRAALSRLLKGAGVRIGKQRLSALRFALSELRAEADNAAAHQQLARASILSLIALAGSKAASVKLQVDQSNLLKMANGKRPIPIFRPIRQFQTGGRADKSLTNRQHHNDRALWPR